MKQAVLLSAIGVMASMGTTAVQAQEVGRVISTTPVIQQVSVPRQVCNQPMVVQQQSSGGGAIVGAIVGGLLGNTIGHGMGRAAATGVGVVAGAAVGDSVEGRSHPQAVQHCTTQTFYENRTTAYNVVYEYAGKQYNVQLPYDPGQTIRLQLTPVSAGGEAPGTAATPSGPSGTPPVIVAPPIAQTEQDDRVGQPVAHIIAAPVTYSTYSDYAPRPVYPAYYGYSRAPYYYPPVSLSFGFGYSGGHRHHHRHHHRHWR